MCNANIAAETSAQSDTHVAVLVGINNGTIFNCYIASSEVSIKSKATPNAGILCGYNNGTIENCYCINSSITDANTKSTITGDLGGIAGGNKGTVKNAYAANITISTKGTQNLHPIAVGNVENVYYIKASDDTRTYTGGIEKDAVWFQSEAAVTALGAEYFTQDARIPMAVTPFSHLPKWLLKLWISPSWKRHWQPFRQTGIIRKMTAIMAAAPAPMVSGVIIKS